MSHRHNDDLSLAYHRVIAQRLLADPSIAATARARVERWAEDGTVPRFYVDAWRAVLRGGAPEVAALLLDESQAATALRQVSPFAGVLAPRERWRIWRERSMPALTSADGSADETS